MSSIPATTAQSDSDAAKAALEAADNAIFIASVDQAIVEATDQGKYQVSATTWGHVSPKTIVDYYINLGYTVALPDYPQTLEVVPAQLFGEFWVAFWNGTLRDTLFANPNLNPVRLLIAWVPPGTVLFTNPF